MLNYNDIILSFSSAMHDVGIVTNDEIIADGKLHRVHVIGDKRGTRNGAYILHDNGQPAGWFQNFKTGISGKWTLSGKREPITLAMRQQIKTAQQQRQIEQQELHIKAAENAFFIWRQSTPTKAKHPYLISKRIQEHNLRQYKGALVVPIYNQDKQLVNLQFINADGSKRFLSGGKKKHCFSVIGKPCSNQPILICEGWATGASLYEHTGYAVIVAMDAGNLEPVSLVIRLLFPAVQIIIAADNDESGVGQVAARAAALAIGGGVICPSLSDVDFNDFLNMEAV